MVVKAIYSLDQVEESLLPYPQLQQRKIVLFLGGGSTRKRRNFQTSQAGTIFIK
jgi:hypothetical protein